MIEITNDECYLIDPDCNESCPFKAKTSVEMMNHLNQLRGEIGELFFNDIKTMNSTLLKALHEHFVGTNEIEPNFKNCYVLGCRFFFGKVIVGYTRLNEKSEFSFTLKIDPNKRPDRHQTVRKFSDEKIKDALTSIEKFLELADEIRSVVESFK